MLKNFLVGLHEAKRDPLEKENKIEKRSQRFAAYEQFLWCTKGLGKETQEFSHHVFCGKSDNITQKQIDGMFYIMKAKKIDKNSICTYIAKLTSIKIIVYLVLHFEICFSIIFSFSDLLMGAMFLGNVFGKSGNSNSTFTLMTYIVRSIIQNK